ncbi:MAG: cell division protein FtsL [Pelagibacteraceae bacterium]|nr:cell division protein FtsL [Pelagibacteraceae bacterium]
MKRFILTLIIFFLILSTSLIKNTTKKIEDEIYNIKENLRSLNSQLEEVFFEYIYLSSSEKLLEFQLLYFEDQLIPKDISEIKLITTKHDANTIEDLNITKN